MVSNRWFVQRALAQGELDQKKRRREERDVGLPPSKKQDRGKKGKVAEDPNEWRDMCAPALEEIFSHLDWKDLGRAMQVCKRWKEVGGHPHLWSNFPLHLASNKLASFTNIRRLDWVKSVRVTLNAEFVNAAAIRALVKRLPKMEELYVNIIGNTEESYFMTEYIELVESSKNKLLRIGIHSDWLDDNSYFITSCDDDTNLFLKKTLVLEGKKKKAKKVQVWMGMSLSGTLVTTYLTTQLLETICANSAETLFIHTDLFIGKKNFPKFLDLLQQHVALFSLENEWFPDNIEVEPYNAILDLLGSKNAGVFRGLELHQDMVLKTDWVDRLGGAAKVKEIKAPYSCMFHTNNGLKLCDLYSEHSIYGLLLMSDQILLDEDQTRCKCNIGQFCQLNVFRQLM